MTQSALKFIIEYKYKIAIYSFLVVVLVGGSIGYISYTRKIDNNFFYSLNKAKTVADYDVLALSYKSKDKSALIAYEKGKLLYDEKKYDQAILVYKSYEKAYPKSFLAPAVLNVLAHAYEQKTDYKNAVEFYQRLRNNYSESVWAKRVVLDIVRVQNLLGDVDTAIAECDSYIENGKNTEIVNKVKKLRSDLTSGGLAQLGEHHAGSVGVTGSSPVSSTINSLKTTKDAVMN